VIRKDLVIAFLASILVFACSSSPDLRVHGQVRDALTGAPIAGARVHEASYAPKLAAGAITDSYGGFAYYTYPEEHNLVVEMEGYQEYKTTIGLNPFSRDETLEIRLTSATDER
jgi:hypothetical protein